MGSFYQVSNFTHLRSQYANSDTGNGFCEKKYLTTCSTIFPLFLKKAVKNTLFFACFLAFHNTLIISHYVRSFGIASFFLQPHEWIIIYTNYIFYNCCKLLSVHECNAYLYVCKHYDSHFFSSVFILGYVTVQ